MFVDNPDRMCTVMLGPVGAGQRFQGCYVPAAAVLVLPRDCDASKGRIGSSCRVLVEHEECHAKGYVHYSNGRGWVRRDQ